MVEAAGAHVTPPSLGVVMAVKTRVIVGSDYKGSLWDSRGGGG